MLSQLTPWKAITYIGTLLVANGSAILSIFDIFTKRIVLNTYWALHRPLPYWLWRFFIHQIFASQALRFYVPEIYSGKLTLFNLKNPGHESHNGWEGLIRGGIDIQEIPGTHEDFIKPPYVEVFAKKLQACLNQNIPDNHPSGQAIVHSYSK